ncbi:MAG: hypothetical protein ACRERU_22300 [Methylococcales bacterium]
MIPPHGFVLVYFFPIRAIRGSLDRLNEMPVLLRNSPITARFEKGAVEFNPSAFALIHHQDVIALNTLRKECQYLDLPDFFPHEYIKNVTIKPIRGSKRNILAVFLDASEVNIQTSQQEVHIKSVKRATT